jgi:hypothetical protein
MVLAAQILQRFEYAYGASIAFRREALDGAALRAHRRPPGRRLPSR